MGSVFAKIIEGGLPAFRIYESELVIAFLALDQINLGHCLVVPKTEEDHFFDVESKEYAAMFEASKHVAKAIKKVTSCVRVGLALQGFEVHHAHIHLIPLWSPEEFDFKKGRPRTKEENQAMQENLKVALMECL